MSIEQMIQEGRGSEEHGAVPVVLITHSAPEGAVRRAIDSVAKERFMAGAPRLLRIERI